jgi:ABC-2 type transport system ATP-binding protein
MKVVKTVGLTKKYGAVLALSDLEVSVKEGDIYGFLGPNGAGKTTTIRIMLGLLAPTSGRVEIFGHGIDNGIRDVLPRIGSVLGDPAFYPHLSGRENLKLIQGLSPKVSGLSVEDGLDLVGLDDAAGIKFSNFSAGMRQRLALASAYMKDPDLFILDEPTNGLDPQGRVEVREKIERLGREGKTVFLSTHLLNEVQEICSRVGVLKEGRLLDESPVSELVLGTSGVVVTADEGEMDLLKKHLGGLDYVEGVKVNGKEALVECPAERSADILSELASSGVEVQEIEKSRRSLEDVFIELTEEEEVTLRDE